MEFVYVLLAIFIASAALCFGVAFVIGYQMGGRDNGDTHER